jgi:hypothetical protein
MKAYVVVEVEAEVPIVRAVLPPDLLDEVFVLPAGEGSNITSVARTILAARRKPVAVLVNTRTLDESLIQERVQMIQYLLRMAAAGVPTKLILFIPHIETLFFQARGLLTKVFGDPLPEDVRLVAPYSPRDALDRLFARARGPKNLRALVDSLDEAGRDALRATPPIRELITFLEDVLKPHPKQTVA